MSAQLINLLIWISAGILVFVLFLLGLKWAVPLYFRYSYAKGFDGSYEPEDDRLKLRKDLPEQDDDPSLVLQKKPAGDAIESYQIRFGKGRSLSAGLVKIYYKGSWYSSREADLSCRSLHLIELSHDSINDLLPDQKKPAQSTQMIWSIPETDLKIKTTHYRFEGRGFVIFESCLIGSFSDLNPQLERIGPINIIYPSFRNESNNRRIFTFRDGVFCPPRRDLHYSHAPVLFFDDNKNCMLVSALDHFLISGVAKEPEGDTYRISCGSNAVIQNYPENHSQRYIMVFNVGINKTFKAWGDLIHEYYGIDRESRYTDVLTRYLGYFTDNGAHYYYNPEPGMKMDETLIAVDQNAKKRGVPYNYYHLDSWWYQKVQPTWKKILLSPLKTILGAWLYGGAIIWERDKDFIEMKISELSENLGGKPFSAHGRWFIKETPYRDQYDFVVETEWAMPFDRSFWEHIMSYCKNNNIQIYEQDWMVNQLRHFEFLNTEVGAAKKWLDDMAETAAEQDITIQYCMETPGMLMNAIQHPNVTHCRTCDDYGGFKPHNYDVPFFTQSSMLAWALGLSPFKDVFWSSKRGLWKGERKPYLMALLSCLSTGPVGPGDEIGYDDKDVIMPCCRSDGLLLQPDRPITACDIVYIKNEKYYFAKTETTIAERTWHYVLVINLWKHRVKDKTYQLETIDIEGDYLIYNWFSHDLRRINSQSVLSADLGFEDYNYLILAPVLKNGSAFFGDISNYACVNNQQFSKLSFDEDSISVELQGVEGDDVDLLYYLPETPDSVLIDGEAVENSSKASSSYNRDLLQLLIRISFSEERTKKVTVNWRI